MNTPSGRFRPVEYPEDFVGRVKAEYANDGFILDLLQRKNYSLGAYLEDRTVVAPSEIRRQLHNEWRQIVDSRPRN